MSAIDQIVSNLEEYIAEKTNAAKKRFAQALNQYIDFRIEGVLEDRKKRVVQEREDLAIKALQTAPALPDLISRSRPGIMDEWIKWYTKWYEGPRKEGLKTK